MTEFYKGYLKRVFEDYPDLVIELRKNVISVINIDNGDQTVRFKGDDYPYEDNPDLVLIAETIKELE